MSSDRSAFGQPRRESVWPKAIGIISGLVGLAGLVMIPLGMPDPIPTAVLGDVPPSFFTWLTFGMVIRAVIALLLVAAGILLFNRRSAGRTLHVAYGLIGLSIGLVGLLIVLLRGTSSLPSEMQTPSATVALLRSAWAMVYPAFLLVWFFRQKIREEVAGWAEMIRRPIGWPEQLLLGAASLLFVVVVYSCLSGSQHLKNPTDKTMPNMSQFVEGWKRMALPKAGKERWTWKDLWPPASRVWLVQDAWATYGRLVIGMVVGVLLASLIGVAMGCFAWVESLFLPVLNFFAKIPPTAMLAVYFIVFGVTFKMYVAMVALGIAPTLTQSIYQAAKKDVTDHAIFKAYTLGASHLETIWNVVCRQILPRALENVRLQVGLAMVFLIAAEMLVAEVGFGYQLRMQSRLQNMNVVYSYLIILGVTGLLIDWGLSSSRRRLCRWFGD